MSLPQFIEITIQAEQAIEQKRQQLATLNMFEPYTIYRRLDQPRLGGFKQEELAEFLTDNNQLFNDYQIDFLFQYLDFDKDDVITYEDLKNIILPRRNQALLDQCMNRQQYEIPVGMLLPNELEKCLTEFFLLIIQYLSQIEQITVNDINLNQVNIYEEDESITVNSLSAWFEVQNLQIDEEGLQIFIGLIDQDGTGRGTQQGLQTLIDQFARFQQQEQGNQIQEESEQNSKQKDDEQEQEIIIVDESENQQQQQQQQQQYENENENEKRSNQNQEPKQQQEQQLNENGHEQNQEDQSQNDQRKILNSQQQQNLYKPYITPNFNNFRSPLLDYYEEQIRLEEQRIRNLEISLGINIYYPRSQSSLKYDFYQSLIEKEIEKINRITLEYSYSPTRLRQTVSYHFDQDSYYISRLKLIEKEIEFEQERLSRLMRLPDYSQVNSHFVQSKVSQLNSFAKPNKKTYENINFESPLKQGQSMQYSYAQKSTPEKQFEEQGRTNKFDAKSRQYQYNYGTYQYK